MTKEELISKLKELQNQRAFSYEDQMKLAILDESPFTLWASDRECKITLWEGQCEALYGYSRDCALGKDFVKLFVAQDEQLAARNDQLSIIDDGAIFHNIANDIAKNRNTLRLVTNCFRIRDLRSGEYWNAEMGLIIDYLDQEKERLEKIVAESRKVKTRTNLFIENSQQRKEQFLGRRKTIKTEIANCERKAIKLSKRKAFKDAIAPINIALENLQQKLFQLVDTYLEKMQISSDADTCEKLRFSFAEEYDNMLLGFEDIVLDFEELNLLFNGDNKNVMLKNVILRENSAQSNRLAAIAFDLINKAENDINEYKKLVNTDPNNQRLRDLTQRREYLENQKKSIEKLAGDFLEMVSKSDDETNLNTILMNLKNQYLELENNMLGK